jgi:hypothetical protein
MPTTPTGELLTRWTVRLALGLYAAGLGLLLASSGRPGWLRVARVVWSAGCALFLVHVACAFHFFHDWGHADAYRETARQTGDLFGAYWGGGLYFNYAFTLAWLADVLWWWARPAGVYLRRTRWVTVPLHAFLLFMAFNATVVFETGPTRWAGVAALAALTLTWWLTRRGRRGHA